MIQIYKPAGKACFGDYQPSSLCDACWAAELCKQEAMHLDGYYDKQAEERDWWEEYTTDLMPRKETNEFKH